MTQKPSVGRIVHYVSYGTPGGEYKSECRAAIITEVPGGAADPVTIGLAVLNPTGMFFNRTNTRHDGSVAERDTNLCAGLDYPGGTWHWAERV